MGIVLALGGIALLALVVVFAARSFFLRRHAEVVVPVQGWLRTDEVFRDPSSGRLMRVWLDERNARRYVAEGELPPEP